MAIFPGSAIPSGVTTYTVDQSCRFDRDDNAYLSWTPGATATDNKKFTISFWAKRGDLGGQMNLFNPSRGGDGTNEAQFDFQSTDVLRIYDSGGNRLHLKTFKVFRDPSAWYHIFVSVDTTESVTADRASIYINGVKVTSFDGSYAVQYPALNATLGWGVDGNIMRIAQNAYNTSYPYDGYLSEFYFIDGTAYTPSDFGETDENTNQWIPIDASGLTFGTNGFYLKFEDSSDFGNDSSGNGNDWTVTNLVATDQMVDSPTNNIATLNPLGYFNDGTGAMTFSEGNLKLHGSGWARVDTTIQSPKSGKWYAEYLVMATSGAGGGGVGHSKIGVATDVYAQSGTSIDNVGYNAVVWYEEGQEYQTVTNGSSSGTSVAGEAYVAGDIIGILLNEDDGEVSFYKNNSSSVALLQDITLPTTTDTYGFAIATYNSQNWTVNFGQDSSFAGEKTAQGNADGNGIGDFYYAPPTDYLALCSSNLSDPEIKLPGDNFNTVLYAGTGLTQSITGVGFQPDLVWAKCRNAAVNNVLYDAVRGTGRLESNNTAAEGTRDGFVGFASDGFDVDDDGGGGNINYPAGRIYVAWNWLGDGVDGGTLNEVGSLDSQVNVNTTSGFSICTYDGNETGGATFGHGLSEAPTLVIAKKTGDTGGWLVGFNAGTAHTGFKRPIRLDTTAVQAGYDDAGYFNSTNPSSTVVTLGNYGDTNKGTGMVAYCFHSVEGYSKIGSYDGNSNADGTFVYIGFRPAWVLIKSYDTAGNSWHLLDDQRSPYNDADLFLFPNGSTEETQSSPGIDFLSNGFKCRENAGGFNQSNYLYIAFAEFPFKYANAR